MRKPFKQHWPDLPQEGAHNSAGLRRIVLNEAFPIASSLQAMTHGVLKPRSSLDWHLHEDKDEIILITQGSGLLHLSDEERFKVKKGDVVYIPSGNRHKLENPTDDPIEGFFLRIFSK